MTVQTRLQTKPNFTDPPRLLEQFKPCNFCKQNPLPTPACRKNRLSVCDAASHYVGIGRAYICGCDGCIALHISCGKKSFRYLSSTDLDWLRYSVWTGWCIRRDAAASLHAIHPASRVLIGCRRLHDRLMPPTAEADPMTCNILLYVHRHFSASLCLVSN